jgi:uncharacterized protein YecE (DUF72 family)
VTPSRPRTRGADIRVGTSGWSYPSGKGTWSGVFYPEQRARRPRGAPKFDELAFYSEHFDTVEVNSSFYRVPTVAAVRKWTERTPPGFEFSLKLYQKFTHPDMFAKATGGDPSTIGGKDVDEFRAAIGPLVETGRLGALLAQFPASFKNDPESRGYLEWLLKAFQDYPVAIELRHRSWSDNPSDTAQMLEEFNAALAQIDEPKFKSSIRQTAMPTVSSFYYLRLHGRNAAQWWKHDTSEDRYNYLYTAEELKPFADAAKASSREVKKAYLYANNHFSAKSVANAAILKAQLGQELDGEYPAEFVERYPELKGMVKLLPEQPALTPLRKPS